MRILRLVDEGRFALEFHPYITVVAEVPDDHRDRIVETFERAAMGRTTDMRGLIEVHGVVLDLDERALGLLELEEGEIETSVLASDLPGNATSGVGRQVRAAERRLEALEQPHRDRLLALGEAEAELEAARAAAAEARRQIEPVGDVPADRADDVERSVLVERRAELQLERDRLFAALDPGAVVALDEARAALEAAAPPVESESESDPDGAQPAENQPAPTSSEGGEDRRSELEMALSLHRLYDPAPVRDALDDVRSMHGTVETVPSTEALSMVERLDELDRAIAALDTEAADDPTPAMVEAAKERVEQARLALAERERQHAASSVEDGDLERLEQAHAEVEQARDALDGRFGRAKAQRRLDEARAAEDELLERLGLHSYTEFLTRGGALGPSASSVPSEIDAARAAVAAAEAEAASLDERLEAALSQAELVEERRRTRDQARALLDQPDLEDDAITAELLEVRVPADVAGPIDSLVEELDVVGLPLRGLELTNDEIEAMAADWLAEYQQSEARLLRSIEDLETGSASAPDDDSTDAPIAIEDLPVIARGAADDSDAREAVEVAEARVSAHETASAALADVEATLADLDVELSEAQPRSLDDDRSAVEDPAAGADAEPESIATTDAAVEAATSAVEHAAAAVDSAKAEYESAVEELAVLRQTVSELDEEPPPVSEIEWYLLARLAAQRQQSFVGSLPLVVAGALDCVTDDEGLEHLLDRLERMAGAVQIVHITDDPRIIGWADALDEDRAAVVRPVTARADAL